MPNPFVNIKAIKSTILGLILIGFAIYMLMHQQTFNLYFAGGLIVSGILLILSPDTLLKLISDFFNKEKEKKKL
jgi:hypothetical protein